MFSKQIINKFKKFAQEELNQDLSDKEAVEILDSLVGFVDKLAEIQHKRIIRSN